MPADRSYIQLNAVNIVTISLCALLGYGLLVTAAKLLDKLRGRKSEGM